MFRAAVLFACLALCHSHAVLPVVVPAAHAVHAAPLVVPYPLYHGYGGHGVLGHHGLLGHGVVAKPLAHHILKRSPHYVAPLHGVEHFGHVAPVAHVAPIAHVAPVAVSHQSRLDVHHSPAIAPIVPVIKPVVPVITKAVVAAPLLHGAGLHGAGLHGAGLHGAGLYGAGLYGAHYPHIAHSHY